jgi:hypothetical protein
MVDRATCEGWGGIVLVDATGAAVCEYLDGSREALEPATAQSLAPVVITTSPLSRLVALFGAMYLTYTLARRG